MPRRLVVIGNGMAAHRLLERLTEATAQRWSITVYGAEQHAGYNRVLLSSVLSGVKSVADVTDRDAAWFERRGIAFRPATEVVAICRQRRVVRDRAGLETPWDHLVLATGSEPIALSLPGAGLSGIHVFRDLGDAATLIEEARPGRRCVVIGGGLLGLEAAWGLAQRGVDVTVVHLAGHLMERQLDEPGGLYVRHALERQGLRFVCNAETVEFEGNGRIAAVRLRDRTRLPADFAVVAVGIRPRTALAREAGLAVHRGVVVDDVMATSDPAISAIGECIEYKGALYGLVAPAHEQAEILAQRLAGDLRARYGGSLNWSHLKVGGVAVSSGGAILTEKGTEEAVWADPSLGIYRKIVLRDKRLAGFVMVGEVTDSAWLVDLLQSGERVAHLRESLLLGRAFAVPMRAAA